MDRNQMVQIPLAGLNLTDNPEVAARLKHVGQAVAVGLATLVAEAGLAWIRRRLERIGQPAPMHMVQSPLRYPVAQSSHPSALAISAPSSMPAQIGGAVTVTSQRVVQTWDHGVLARETVERNVWRREQEW